MGIPRELVAGDSATWFDAATSDNIGRSIAPPDWTLVTSLRGATELDLTATADNGQFKTSISAAQSAALTAGVYYWQARASMGSEKITIGSGQITIKADLSAADPVYDGRSQLRKDLEAVQAAMRAMIAGGAVQAYTIGNRQMQKMSMADLIQLENKLKNDVMNEERAQNIANGLGDPRTLKVRFT